MVYVQGGTFQMDSNTGYNDESKENYKITTDNKITINDKKYIQGNYTCKTDKCLEGENNENGNKI